MQEAVTDEAQEDQAVVESLPQGPVLEFDVLQGGRLAGFPLLKPGPDSVIRPIGVQPQQADEVPEGRQAKEVNAQNGSGDHPDDDGESNRPQPRPARRVLGVGPKEGLETDKLKGQQEDGQGKRRCQPVPPRQGRAVPGHVPIEPRQGQPSRTIQELPEGQEQDRPPARRREDRRDLKPPKDGSHADQDDRLDQHGGDRSLGPPPDQAGAQNDQDCRSLSGI